jgi:membrane protein implicated in regulation of membrane protease activity
MFALAMFFMLFAVKTMNVVLWAVAAVILVILIARRRSRASHRT